MVKKILKYIGIAVACIVVAVFSSALLYRKYLQHRVAEERAIISPSGINSLQSVRICGIDQWIEVRGQNVNNPILLFSSRWTRHCFHSFGRRVAGFLGEGLHCSAMGSTGSRKDIRVK